MDDLVTLVTVMEPTVRAYLVKSEANKRQIMRSFFREALTSLRRGVGVPTTKAVDPTMDLEELKSRMKFEAARAVQLSLVQAKRKIAGLKAGAHTRTAALERELMRFEDEASASYNANYDGSILEHRSTTRVHVDLPGSPAGSASASFAVRQPPARRGSLMVTEPLRSSETGKSLSMDFTVDRAAVLAAARDDAAQQCLEQSPSGSALLALKDAVITSTLGLKQITNNCFQNLWAISNQRIVKNTKEAVFRELTQGLASTQQAVVEAVTGINAAIVRFGELEKSSTLEREKQKSIAENLRKRTMPSEGVQVELNDDWLQMMKKALQDKTAEVERQSKELKARSAEVSQRMEQLLPQTFRLHSSVAKTLHSLHNSRLKFVERYVDPLRGFQNMDARDGQEVFGAHCTEVIDEDVRHLQALAKYVISGEFRDTMFHIGPSTSTRRRSTVISARLTRERSQGSVAEDIVEEAFEPEAPVSPVQESGPVSLFQARVSRPPSEPASPGQGMVRPVRRVPGPAHTALEKLHVEPLLPGTALTPPTAPITFGTAPPSPADEAQACSPMSAGAVGAGLRPIQSRSRASVTSPARGMVHPVVTLSGPPGALPPVIGISGHSVVSRRMPT
eukprot:RCo018893